MDDFAESASLKERLRSLPEKDFFNALMHIFTADTSILRMQSAITVMEERFSAHSKSAQLTVALDRAVRKNNITMVDYLLSQGALIDGTKTGYLPGLLGPASCSPLATAVLHGTKEMLDHLLRMGADPNPPGNDFIYDAAYISGSAEKTRSLLDAGARGGAERALYALILVSPQFDIADMILEKTNISVNVNDGKIVKSAVISLSRRTPDSEGIAQFLLSRGADFERIAKAFEGENSDYTDSQKLAEIAHAYSGIQPKTTGSVRAFGPKS